jgi:hypothetical protein
MLANYPLLTIPLPFQGDGVYGFTRRVAAGCYAMSFQDEIFIKVF